MSGSVDSGNNLGPKSEVMHETKFIRNILLD